MLLYSQTLFPTVNQFRINSDKLRSVITNLQKFMDSAGLKSVQSVSAADLRSENISAKRACSAVVFFKQKLRGEPFPVRPTKRDNLREL